MDAVYLDELDGFEFQELCAKIFERLGWGETRTLTTQDKGRDVIVSTSRGAVIVECKHSPGSTVGRPVVQKLHSATISSDGIKGIVITTGKFSKAATDHAREISEDVPIELVDLYALRELAHKAGINIYRSAADASPVIYGHAIDHGGIERRVTEEFMDYKSSPARAGDLVKIKSVNISVRPAYRIKYDIRQVFSSATYKLKSISEAGRVMMIAGGGGKIIDESLVEFVDAAPLVNFEEIISDTRCSCGEDPRTLTDHFTVGRGELLNIANRIIVNRYTSVVKYKGKNNVTYKKVCTPSTRNIRIADVKRVLLAEYAVDVGILGQVRTRRVMDNTDSTRFVDSGTKCDRCAKKIGGGRGQICNACGRLTHARRMVRSCGFECKECKKTVCPACTTSTRRWLFFKKRLCGRCAEVPK